MFETISIDVESIVCEYLESLRDFDEIAIRTKKLGSDVQKKAILVRREGNWGDFDQSPVDGAKMFVFCRGETPDESLNLALQVRNKLHRIQNIRMGDYHCYSSFIESGPTWYDDDDNQLYGVRMIFNMAFREE